MNKERICILVSSLEGKDGISRDIAKMSLAFEDEIVVFTSKYNPDLTFEISKKTKIIEIKNASKEGFLSSLFFTFFSSWEIANYIRRKKEISVLNSYGLYNIIPACMVKILLPGRKLRISALVYDEEEFIHSLIGCGKLKKLWRELRLLLVKIFVKLGMVEDIFVLSNVLAEFAAERLNTDRVKVLRTGVSFSIEKLSNIKELRPSEKLKKFTEKKGDINLFFHGILVPRRRVEDLLLAIHLLIKEYGIKPVLCIGGSLKHNTQYVNTIKKEIVNLKLQDNINFLEELSEEELAYMYKWCDIFVFPCENQSWGAVPLEAMLFEKPVILSTGCGVSEVLNNDVAVLIPPRRPEMIKEAIFLLAKDNKLREIMGHNARDYVLKNFTFSKTAEELRKIWRI